MLRLTSRVVPGGVRPRQGVETCRSRWACVTGVSCIPDGCHVCGERLGGQGPSGARPPEAAPQAFFEASGREPNDLAAGNRSRVVVRGCSAVRVRPVVRVVRGHCRWLQSSPMRVPGRGRGTSGGPRQGRSGGSHQDGG